MRRSLLFAAAAAALLGAGSRSPDRPAAARRDALVFAVAARGGGAPAFSSAELRRVFLGELTRWKDGRRIALALPPAGSPAGRALYARVVRMSDIDYSQHWLGLIFRGEAVAPPRVIPAPEEMKRLLARSPDTLGVLLASDVGSRETSFQLLAIDGAVPGTATYPYPLP